MLAELDQNFQGILIEVLFLELYRYARIFLFIWDYYVLTNRVVSFEFYTDFVLNFMFRENLQKYI